MTRLSVSVPEAAQLLGLSRSSTYAAVQRGEIPSVRVGGRVLIPLQRLTALINGEAPAVSEASSEEIVPAVNEEAARV